MGQVRDHFEHVLQLPPDERGPYLDSACPDPGRRAQVERLLEADARASDFLETPVVIRNEGESHERDEALLMGQTVGRYEILGPLGEGGMGRVYCARRSDGHFDRLVAIKVIRDGLGGKAMVSCFLRERQILASLDHPGIARLLDGGSTEDGRPFLVMEHIDGEPLLSHCRRLPEIEARLRLFLEICEAVQYAHRRLVMHRDLKPDNVLVDAQGRPRLLDFGTAKLLDDAQLEGGVEPTATARHWCSPSYASPEQMGGEPVSTATDIYGLGGVLYAMLTDQGPHRFTSNSPIAMARVVIEETVELPSRAAGEAQDPVVASWSRRLRGDLDTIVLTAMAKKPERRYRSVDALVDDVRRYLEHRPIRARPPTLGYRVDRFLHRHWRGTVVAGLLTLVALVGALAFVAQARETALARDRAEAQHAPCPANRCHAGGDVRGLRSRSIPGSASRDSSASRPQCVGASTPWPRTPRSGRRSAIPWGWPTASWGDYADADRVLSEVVRARRRHLGPGHPGHRVQPTGAGHRGLPKRPVGPGRPAVAVGRRHPAASATGK